LKQIAQVNLFIPEVMPLFMSIFYIKISNNSVDINVLECCEKEKFSFDKLDSASVQALESDSRFDKEIQSYALKKVLRKK